MEESTAKEVRSDDLFEHHRIVVDPNQTPIRIDKYLMEKLYQISRNKIQLGIKAGNVEVNDKKIKSNHKVKPGQVITIVLPKPPSDENVVVPEFMDLDIRYEDEDLMIIHKPAGLVVHPGVGIKRGTLVNGLAHYFKHTALPIMEGNQPDRPGLVHRIDKDTTGLMVIAKTEFALTHLAKQFFDHSIDRKYWALVWGEPDADEGTINKHIGRDEKQRTKMTVYPDGDQGKHAITHWKMLRRMYYVSLLECELETGRTHQIRVHLASEGHYLFNDEKYGGHRIRKGTIYTKYRQFVENCFKIMPRQALHARMIGFEHPRTGERMQFEADLPEDFAAVLEKWNTYLSGRTKHE